MSRYPATRQEITDKVLTFTRGIPQEELRSTLLDLHDGIPLTPTLEGFLFPALWLLGAQFGGPYPEAARDLLALALEYAYFTGGDLGEAANAFIEEHSQPRKKGRVYTQEDLERTLKTILEGGEEPI